MKTSRSNKFRWKTALSATALLWMTTTTAAERDISAELLQQRDKVAFASVFTLPVSFTFRMTQEEHDVVTHGCEYQAVDRNDLDDLLNLLMVSQLHERSDKHDYDMRFVIRLRLRDSRQVSLALSSEYVGQSARGTLDGSVPIEARMGFQSDLLRWKHGRKPVRDKGLICQD
jgi:hypothetical protein